MPIRFHNSDYFSTFKARLEAVPVQAPLLSSPADREIASVIRDHGEDVQAITGESVTVLVPIDAAAPGVRKFSGLTSWHRSPAAWALLGQFLTLAGVRWDELPALVVGRSVFTGPRLVVPTSGPHLLDQ